MSLCAVWTAVCLCGVSPEPTLTADNLSLNVTGSNRLECKMSNLSQSPRRCGKYAVEYAVVDLSYRVTDLSGVGYVGGWVRHRPYLVGGHHCPSPRSGCMYESSFRNVDVAAPLKICTKVRFLGHGTKTELWYRVQTSADESEI